jgi:outer membrane immunogenic protein
MRMGVVVGSQQLLRNLDIVAQQFRHRGIFMKRLALAVSVLGISAASAFAADLPAHTYIKAPMMMAAYDWSGFYVGANGGYGSSSNCWNLDNIAGVPLAPSVIPEGCHDATGGVAGGQVGYRWQTGALVAGLEAQGNWADLRGSNLSSAFGPAVTNQSKIDAFGLFTGQFGYAWNNTLLYVKSGLAVTSAKYQGLTTGVAFDGASETRVGYTAGVGIEYGFTPNWSLALEYDHLFMFESDNAFTAVGGGALTRIDSIHQDVDLVTARLNYRFGGPVVARY